MSGRAAHRRRLGVLAVLALARGRPVGRERLIGLLWPEQPADSARHTLSESIYVLRKELGEDALLPAGSDVALNPAVVGSDVGELEAALEAGDDERAARIYGGPLLDGFYVADAPEFERWVEVERDRLARSVAAALERLAEAAEARGSSLGAVEWWRRLATHDPYSSRVALRLARALDAAGERPAALRSAEAHAALLREELGVGPDPRLAEFMQALRTAPAVLPAPPVPSPRPPVPASPLPPLEPAQLPPAAAGEEAERGSSSPGRADALPLIEAPSSPPKEDAVRVGPRGMPASRRRPARVRALAAVGGLLVGMVLSVTNLRTPAAAVAPEPGSPHRIAVLYFDDHTPGRALDYLAAGLTEMLIHELSQVPALEVVSRNGVKPYRDGRVPLDTLAARLGVQSVVEGSVQASGDSVWVTVQLIDAATQAHLESRIIGRPMNELLSLERGLAEEVAGFLRRRMGAEVRLRQARAETRSPEARAMVLQAQRLRSDAARIAGATHALDAGSAAGLLLRADSLLAGAQRADPRWARPLVERGWVAGERARLAEGRRRAALQDSALAYAARALAREPRNAEALELAGRTRFVAAAGAGDTTGQGARLDRAERELRAAVAARPSLASAWSTLSVLLRVRGRLAEADLAARRALAEDAWLEDADAVLHRLFASALMLGDYREAASLCERGRRQFPADWRFVECALTLMREDPARAPDVEGAWRLVAELDRLDPPERARSTGRAYSPLYRRALVAAVLARAGAADSARALLARTRAAAERDRDAQLSLNYDEAYVRLWLGEREVARRLLDELTAARPALRSFIARDPLFRDLAPAAGGSRPPG